MSNVDDKRVQPQEWQRPSIRRLGTLAELVKGGPGREADGFGRWVRTPFVVSGAGA